MTVAEENPITQTIIVGGELTIPWEDWTLNDEDELTVTKQINGEGAVIPLALNTDYTVEANDLGNPNGGTITPIGAESPVTAGDVWTLERDTKVNRSEDFSRSGAFFAVTANEQYDKAIQISQDQKRDLAAAVRKEPGDGASLDPILPPPVAGRGVKYIQTGPNSFGFINTTTDPDDGSVKTIAGLLATAFPVSSNIFLLESQDGYEIRVDTSGGDVDITLIDSSTLPADLDVRFAIVKSSSDENVVNVKVQGSDTLNGGTSDIIQTIQYNRTIYALDQSSASYIASVGVAPFLAVVRVISSTPITLDSTDNGKLLRVDTSGGDIDITLADSSGLTNDFRVSIEKTTSDLNVVNVKVAGSDTVNGLTSDVVQKDQYQTNVYKLDASAASYTVTLPAPLPALYKKTLNIDHQEPIFTGSSFSVLAQDTAPFGIAFNTDGTRMFMVGASTDTVFEYSLSVGFDLSSTVAFTGNSFSVAAQDTTPIGIAFNTDGTRMFIVGDVSSAVFEYSLSVGFDLGSTVAFTGNSFSVAAQDTTPRGIAFNVDGTKMFIVGDVNNTVFEYSLSVGFDLSSTVLFTGNSFSVAAQDMSPFGIAFNTDGTRMFIVGDVSDAVFEYSLSVGFDLSSTVAFNGNAFSVAAQDTAPSGIAFNTDGKKMFMVGISTDTVFEYSLSVGFDLTFAVAFTRNSFSVAAQDTAPQATAFNTDGTKMFIVGDANNTVFEYSLSVGFDLGSTVVFTGNSFSIAGQETIPTGIAFNTDGTKMFIVGDANNTVFEYSLSVGFDLGSTVVFTGNSFSVAGQETIPTGIAFNTDGTKMFIVGLTNDTVFEYSLSVGFDLSSTVLFTGNSFSVATQDTAPLGIAFNADGTKMFIVGQINDTVFEYSLSVGFDLSSTVLFTNDSFSVAAQDTASTGLAFNTDGTKMFIVGDTNNTVFEYKLKTPFSLFNGFVISVDQDGFLFILDTTLDDIAARLPSTTEVPDGFRVGLMKESASNDAIVSVGGVLINGGVSVTFTTQFKVVLCFADIENNRYFADVG